VNGDGTGLGWYEHRAEPALFRSITPAWGDENLVELATEIRTRLFLAHVRGRDRNTGAAEQLSPVPLPKSEPSSPSAR
jgi:predicted glutamine amidotransferase